MSNITKGKHICKITTVTIKLYFDFVITIKSVLFNFNQIYTFLSNRQVIKQYVNRTL